MARSLTIDPSQDVATRASDAPVPRPISETPPATRSFADIALYVLFAIGIVANVILQKIAVPVTGGDGPPIMLPVFVGAIVLTATVVRPQFDPIRVAGFFLFFAVASFSTFFLSLRYSASSLMLFAALYVPLCINFETSSANYRRCMNLFITVMLGFVGVTLAQHVSQVMFSYRVWPNLNLLLPSKWIIPFYNYIQPIISGSRFMKPNGVVFLEVSLLSQFIALALAFELVLFRRPVRMIVLTTGLMLTLAGTGALLMLMTLPVLLGRMRIRTAIPVLVLLAFVCLIAFRVGWFDIVSARMDEYKHTGSSANLRFILPLERMLDFLDEPRAMIAGIGAGQIEKNRGFLWWPFTKVAIEYGFLSALLFYGFIVYSLFRRAPDRAIAFVLLVWFTFEGTLLTAFNPLSLVLFGAMLRIAPDGTRPRGLTRPTDRPGSSGTAGSSRRPPRSTPPPAQPDADVTGDALLDLHGTPDSAGRLVYAIGDLHGRADLFDRMLDAIRADVVGHPGGYVGKPMIVLLGDYIDRGPASAQVIDRILALECDPAFEVRSVLGNHEDAMLAFFDRRSSGISWGRHGGLTTVTSYGVAPPLTETVEHWAQTRLELCAAVPEAHVAYLRRLEHYIVVGDVIFVHAGLRPGVPLERQRLKDILYIREEFLDAPVAGNLLVVHGHTPQDEPYGARARICVDTGAYATGVLTAVRFDGGRAALVAVR